MFYFVNFEQSATFLPDTGWYYDILEKKNLNGVQFYMIGWHVTTEFWLYFLRELVLKRGTKFLVIGGNEWHCKLDSL